MSLESGVRGLGLGVGRLALGGRALRSGFTLIEMVVVLVVMAIAAHLAVREFGRVRDRRMTESADRQLVELRDAVWSLDSEGIPCGFLADMGRMPRRIDELWKLPQDAGRFAVTNVTGAIHVPTGWQGPYIRLPPGRDALYDPWGNDIGTTTNSEGFVTNVFHMGSSGLGRTRSADVSLVPDGGASAALVVVLEPGGADGASVAWYGPDGSGGVTNASGLVTLASPVRFEGLTPGVRILSCGASGMRVLRIKPGDNIIQLRATE